MDFQRFVGIPYVEHGRGWGGCDCWGLVWLFYRDEMGITLPDYLEQSAAIDFDRYGLSGLITEEAKTDWIPVAEGRAGDVALIRRGHALSHVGIVTGLGTILHTISPNDALLERVSAPRLASRIASIYRHVSRT